VSEPDYSLTIAATPAPTANELNLRDWGARIDPVTEAPAIFETDGEQQFKLQTIALSVVRNLGEAPAEQDRFCEPLITGRNEPITLDGSIRSDRSYVGAPSPPKPPKPAGDKQLPPGLDPPVFYPRPQAILDSVHLPASKALPATTKAPLKIAVIDRDFSRLAELTTAKAEGRLWDLKTISIAETSKFDQTVQVGHGTAMVMTLLETTDAVVVPYQLGLDTERDYDYVGATQIALALANAFCDEVDIVLIASNRTLIGTPRHLRRVLRELAHEGRNRRGTLIVCSSGDAEQTGDEDKEARSHALAADDPCAQPECLVVAAHEIYGGDWERRRRVPLSRLGPAVEITAPGAQFFVKIDKVPARADDTSLASALVAASAHNVLRQHPTLTAAELRALLCSTTVRPRRVDRSACSAAAEASGCNDWDHSMHSLKLGFGRVDALRATLSAVDPLCAAFVQADRTDRWDHSRFIGVALAQNWYLKVRACNDTLAVDYVRWAPRLALLFLHHFEVRRLLMWIARHLVELATATPTSWPTSSHGSLAHRTSLALSELQRHLPQDCALAFASFAARVEHAIVAGDGAAFSTVLAKLVARA
jgi:hypothetical protein